MSGFYGRAGRDIAHAGRGRSIVPTSISYAERRAAEQDAMDEEHARMWRRVYAERRARINRYLAAGTITEEDAEKLRGMVEDSAFDAIMGGYVRGRA